MSRPSPPEDRRALRVYRMLLRLFPRGFLRERRADLERLFLDMRATRRREGRSLGPRFWLDLAWDTVSHAVREHLQSRGWERVGVARPGGRTPFSLLDVKLAGRMLVKHPGLTVVGGLAMAFGIWTGALTFDVAREMVAPGLPLEEGDRVVGIQYIDLEAGRPVTPSLEDFATWREEVRSVVDLGAFRTVSRNLIVDGMAGAPVEVAEMSAAGFRVARVPPLHGRTLVGADEDAGAPQVLVLGFDVWQSRFAGDPDIAGTTVGIGGTKTTVVGVMPEGFAFPVAHQAWVPLRSASADLPRGGGPPVAVFGRLAPGVDLEGARSELEVVSSRRAAAFPEAFGLLRAGVLPYARSVVPLPEIGAEGLAAVNAFMIMLFVLICGNVALLMFARGATREREIAVRSALGASRARILGQLFVEALVLVGLAAIVGFSAAGMGKDWYVAMLEADAGGGIPFWIGGGLAPATVLYLLPLTVLGAFVAGVGPALKLTGARLESRLRRLGSGISGFQLSGVWTPVIVLQVAITLAFPATAFLFHRYVHQIRNLDLGFAAEEYLSVRLAVDDPPEGTDAVRLPSAHRALKERLAADPGVRGVTFADRLPGDAHPRPPIEIDIDQAGPDAPSGRRASVAWVEPGFFQVLGAPIRVGRPFDSGDVASEPRVAIVNRSFVEELLGGRNAVGQRVRAAARGDEPAGPWLEIVGVADDLGMLGGDVELRDEPGMYLPIGTSEPAAFQMAIHLPAGPEAFAPRLRTIAAAVAPDLRLEELRRLDRVSESRWRESEFLARLLGGVGVVALILSLTTIYSVMSFAVSRRTREIGVRVALGSSRRRIVQSVFRGPLVRVGVGIVLGMGLVGLVTRGLVGPLSPGEVVLVAIYSAAMLGVCLLACVVPTRRALAVEPTQALRAEG